MAVKTTLLEEKITVEENLLGSLSKHYWMDSVPREISNGMATLPVGHLLMVLANAVSIHTNQLKYLAPKLDELSLSRWQRLKNWWQN